MGLFVLLMLFISIILYVFALSDIYKRQSDEPQSVRVFWIWLVILLPIFGSSIYFFTSNVAKKKK